MLEVTRPDEDEGAIEVTEATEEDGALDVAEPDREDGALELIEPVREDGALELNEAEEPDGTLEALEALVSLMLDEGKKLEEDTGNVILEGLDEVWAEVDESTTLLDVRLTDEDPSLIEEGDTVTLENGVLELSAEFDCDVDEETLGNTVELSEVPEVEEIVIVTIDEERTAVEELRVLLLFTWELGSTDEIVFLDEENGGKTELVTLEIRELM